MAKKSKQEQPQQPAHYCRECCHVKPLTDFHTLTVHGKKPTLGRCPFWAQSRSVLLSQKACEHFKE